MAFSFEILFFGITAAIAVILAILMLAVRSPIHSALCLVGVMVMLAVNYLMLHAYFLAAVQVVVYAGAVMVLFVYVIMFFYRPGKVDKHKSETQFTFIAGAIILSLSLLIGIVASLYITGTSTDINKTRIFTTATGDSLMSNDIEVETPTSDMERQKRNPQRIGELLFTKYLLPFELTSLLLLAAMVGAVVLAKRSPEAKANDKGGTSNA